MAHARASEQAVPAEPHNAVKVSTACPLVSEAIPACRSLCTGAQTADTAFRARGDVCPHISAVEKAGLNSLNEGQVVEYEEVANRGKTSAENLKV
jgi:cold shock CspA family protein